jgi:uncharacterized iron-regulated protein
VLTVLAPGCGLPPRPAGPVAAPCVVAGRWTDPATGRHPAQGDVLVRASQARIVLLGERHDAPEDHRWQLDVLAGLLASTDRLAVGFEAFARPAQETLDAWAEGDLSVDAMLERSRWRDAWGMDPTLYLPLLHFGRRHRLPLVALNVERALVARVGRAGWDSLSPSERQGLGDPAPPAPRYVERLLASYADHTCRPPAAVRDTPGFRRFLDAQLLWDRAMAEALAATATRPDAPLVVGLIGSGHLEYADGVPHQLRALGIDEVVVLLPWDVSTSCTVPRGVADGVFGVAPVAAERPRPVRHACPPRDGAQPPR